MGDGKRRKGEARAGRGRQVQRFQVYRGAVGRGELGLVGVVCPGRILHNARLIGRRFKAAAEEARRSVKTPLTEIERKVIT